jgi:hypothetical protein
MRCFDPKAGERQKDAGLFKVVALLFFLGLTPVWAFGLDWRLGVFILGAFGALGFGAWRVSRGR